MNPTETLSDIHSTKYGEQVEVLTNLEALRLGLKAPRSGKVYVRYEDGTIGQHHHTKVMA